MDMVHLLVTNEIEEGMARSCCGTATAVPQHDLAGICLTG